MSKDRFITQVFAGGTRDTVVGTSINGYAIGEWADKVDEQIASLTDNLYNLLQEQVQKVSLGFPASVPNIKDLGDIKIDSITKDISHDVVIDPNPPKLYEEAALPNLTSVDINALVELLSTCSQLVCAVESLYPYPDLQARSGISAIDLRQKIADMIHALTHPWVPYTQRDDK